MGRMIAAALLLALPAFASARAQTASLRGRVLTDSSELPIEGVVVEIQRLGLTATSDSLGNFVLQNISPGIHIVTARKIGFDPINSRITFGRGAEVEADLLLAKNAQVLPGVKVETAPSVPAKLVEFEERRHARSGGHFLTRDDFAKKESSLTSDVLRTVPGLDFIRDTNRGSAFYITGGRLQQSGTAFSPNGRPAPCFAGVVLDGAWVFRGKPYEPPFDINSVGPAHIAGFEYYSSPASIPIKYSGEPNVCGVAVIWTR